MYFSLTRDKSLVHIRLTLFLDHDLCECALVVLRRHNKARSIINSHSNPALCVNGGQRDRVLVANRLCYLHHCTLLHTEATFGFAVTGLDNDVISGIVLECELSVVMSDRGGCGTRYVYFIILSFYIFQAIQWCEKTVWCRTTEKSSHILHTLYG